MNRETILSKDRCYRYTLWRDLKGRLYDGDNEYAMFIGLNPSTADETQDDPTIRRCMDFARQWGYGALCMTNLFAFRATDPAVMKASPDPVGPDNDRLMAECATNAGIVVAAWGTHGTFRGRGDEVRARACFGNATLFHLGLTKEGHPRHPLYLKKSTTPTVWK